jgi:outer membrane immunogenic protein
MKKLPFIAAVAALIATPVLAADMAVKMPVKAPPPMPAPVYNWTGWYVGGNLGYSWAKANTDFDAQPVTVNATVNGGPYTFDIPGFTGSQSVKPAGMIGGGQIGYNWQYSPTWVAGLEADIQASGEKHSNSFTTSSTSPDVDGGIGLLHLIGTAVTNYEAKISWFGTVRGRIGYLWDRLMLYATGGLAYGEVGVNGTSTVNSRLFASTFSIATALGHSQINAGWTLGAGLEGPLIGNWTLKAEYLYIDLGSLNDPDLPSTVIGSVTGGQTTTRTHFTDNILRIGLNYQFH